MTNEQITKELSKFTKEEIIEALCNTNLSVNTTQLIIYACHEARSKNEIYELEAAMGAWRKASQDHVKYINKVKEEYKDVPIVNLPKAVIDKLYELKIKEEECWKEINNSQDKIDNHIKKLLTN